MKLSQARFELRTGWTGLASSDNKTVVEAPAAWTQTLVFVFGPENLLANQAVMNDLRAAYPGAVISGASTFGAIDGDRLHDEQLIATILEFSSVQLRVNEVPVHEIDGSREAGRQVGIALASHPNLKGIFVLADGLTVNGSELLHGLNEICPNVPVAGGMAGDGTRFSQTWVVADGHATQKMVHAIGFYGDQVIFNRGCHSGAVGFGPLRKVTKSQNNVVYEIDGEPALDLYENYLGELATKLPASATYFPLSLRRNQSDEVPLLRSVLGINKSDRSITVAGDMPINSWTQFMRATHGQLIDGAQHAVDDATQGSPSDQPILALTVSCFGRRVLLGERTDDELELIHHNLPNGSVHTGFFSYGEISAFNGSTCDFHNMTLALTVIGEN